MRSWTKAAVAATAYGMALATIPGAILTIAPVGVASADVCASAGRRVTVSGCANLSDVMAPYVPPPAYYAPMPDDYYVPPPPPPPPVSGCIGYNGRRVNVAGCN
jgi:hypothetical protein